MDDLKSVTVEYLRDLARKHLGKGHSKLRSKAQLVAALAVAVPALAALAKLAGVKLPGKKKAAGAQADVKEQSQQVKAKGKKAAPARKAAPASKSVVDGRKSAVTDEKKAAETDKKAPKGAKAEARKAAPTVKPAQVVNFPPKARTAARSEPEASTPSTALAPAAAEPTPAEPPPQAPPPPPVQHDAEPLVEGFFVARVRGEDEARRHHLTEGQGQRSTVGTWGYDENLGELPLDYGDDAALALPRDPHSLYVTWDFNAATRNRAVDGLEAPRAVLRVFDGETLVREVDFALESRSFYIHGLPPGRPYRVEAHFIARDGRSRRIGHSTNRVTLPRMGPSTDTTMRFMRMPVRMPPAAPVEPLAAAAPTRSTRTTVEEREYITWRRVPLPGSGGFEDLPEVRRETLTTELPEAQHLEVPSRPRGSSEQQYLAFVARPQGSSEQQYLEISTRPQGSSEQRYLEVSRAEGSSEFRYLEVSRAEASSEHRYLESSRAEGSSDQTTWTPPPSGRGRQ